MNIDLHNHTPRCKHAEGSIDEFIQSALDHNINIFGFSDHAPMDFDQKHRMDFTQMREYEKEVRDASLRYQDQIEISLGYEVDWLPGHMDERVLHAEVDYLIGSVHFLSGWGFDNPEFLSQWKEQDVDEVWQNYFSAVTEMAKSTLFDIVGHFDLIKIFGYRPQGEIPTFAEEALDAIAHAEMTLEINAAGWRKPVAEVYPAFDLLKMAYDRKIPITFASDAHRPDQVGYKIQELHDFARAAGYDKAASFRNREPQLHKF